jgi:hypothetical protein
MSEERLEILNKDKLKLTEAFNTECEVIDSPRLCMIKSLAYNYEISEIDDSIRNINEEMLYEELLNILKNHIDFPYPLSYDKYLETYFDTLYVCLYKDVRLKFRQNITLDKLYELVKYVETGDTIKESMFD